MIDIKNQIKNILTKEQLNNDDIEYLMGVIPELRFMVNFDHKHPHHHLDVWKHTLAVLDGVAGEDLDLRMAALFHDIGKPFSYQEDGDVRHFHGHPEASRKITENVMSRLFFDPTTIKNVCYLVETHDTIIDVDNLDNSKEMIDKRLKLQYADAKAHAPHVVKQRTDYLDNIKENLTNSFKNKIDKDKDRDGDK